VSRVYTEVAVFDVGVAGVVVRETFAVGVDELRERLDVPLTYGP
jgi:3-oxoadipate CoA-transferase beta subunit